jgi:hypothetical protein
MATQQATFGKSIPTTVLNVLEQQIEWSRRMLDAGVRKSECWMEQLWCYEWRC